MPGEVSQTLLAGPLLEEPVGLFLVDGTAVHPELQQILAGLPHERSRGNPQALHDLVPVERRTDGGEILLLGQASDPFLQLVLEPGELPRPGRVRGGAVGSGEKVEAIEERTGVPNVPAEPAVGPAPAGAPAARARTHRPARSLRPAQAPLRPAHPGAT